MARRATAILRDLHAWAGSLFALFLFLLFFSGAFLLFRAEIRAWADPWANWEPPPGGSVGATIGALVEEKTDALWLFELRADGAGIHGVSTWDASGGARHRVDARGALTPVRSELDGVLARLHLFHPLPHGFHLTGIVGVALVLLAASGAWMQRRRLSPRPLPLGPGWLGLHRALGTLGLPFLLLFALTGAAIALGPLLLRAHLPGTFQGEREALTRAAAGLVVQARPSGRAASHDWDEVLARARAAIPGFVPTSLRLDHPLDEEAVAHVYGYAPGLRGFAGVALRARDGALLDRSAPGRRGPAAELAAASLGLHTLARSGAFLRWLCALLSLAGAATAASGVAVWLARRKEKGSHRWLLRLSVGCGAGLAAATAALFAANRLLPWDLPARPAWESGVFFGGWLAALSFAFLRREARLACSELLFAAGACSLAAVAADLFHPASPPGVRLCLAGLAIACLAGAARLRGRASAPPLPRATGGVPTGLSRGQGMAALFGGLPAALAWSLGLAHALPFERELRFAWGSALFVPLWVALLIGLSLPRSGGRAWGWAAALGAGGALLLLFP